MVVGNKTLQRPHSRSLRESGKSSRSPSSTTKNQNLCAGQKELRKPAKKVSNSQILHGPLLKFCQQSQLTRGRFCSRSSNGARRQGLAKISPIALLSHQENSLSKAGIMLNLLTLQLMTMMRARMQRKSPSTWRARAPPTKLILLRSCRSSRQ